MVIYHLLFELETRLTNYIDEMCVSTPPLREIFENEMIFEYLYSRPTDIFTKLDYLVIVSSKVVSIVEELQKF